MAELSKGANTWLAEREFTIGVEFPAKPANVDLFSVLVRADGSAGSDRDLVFFNQPRSPCGAVTLAEVATVQVRLDSVPAEVATIVIAAALDDTNTGTFACSGPGEVTVRSATGVLATHTIAGLTSERCVVLVEIYRHDEQWKIRAVSQGWVNGIADLIESYGIVVYGPEPKPTVAPKLDVIAVPDEYGHEPIGSGEHAWRKKLDEQPLDRFEELHAAEYEQGLVRGTHFLKWSDEIARLKREGHLHEVLTVLLEILDATERVQAQERANAPVRTEWFQKFGQEVVVRETPPGWTENAAIVLRKLGDLKGEIAIIDRWLAHAGDPTHWWVQAMADCPHAETKHEHCSRSDGGDQRHLNTRRSLRGDRSFRSDAGFRVRCLC
ncbi:TerD family protein [Rhodococcus opacus]|uniref:TerD family protein n=1 Tax=Rhodococcus opacus TaxID=37919 RepID=UPI002949BD6B|nr:TerD family protein [Rhodococcus opacus]MDV6247235.1 TerD family protein [Rhodococcus opacus]